MKWSADGSSILHLDTEDGVENIYEQPLDGSPGTKTTQFRDKRLGIGNFDLSSDGKRLAICRYTSNTDVILIEVFNRSLHRNPPQGVCAPHAQEIEANHQPGAEKQGVTKMARKLVPSSSPYAPVIGFSRAVRVGNFVSVGGTAPIDAEGNTVGVGDPGSQTRQCMETIKTALEAAGASLADVVRTRMLLTNIDDWKEIAKVRGEYFRDIRPVDTVMEVSRFINPEWLVEIEVDAVLESEME